MDRLRWPPEVVGWAMAGSGREVARSLSPSPSPKRVVTPRRFGHLRTKSESGPVAEMFPWLSPSARGPRDGNLMGTVQFCAGISNGSSFRVKLLCQGMGPAHRFGHVNSVHSGYRLLSSGPPPMPPHRPPRGSWGRGPPGETWEPSQGSIPPDMSQLLEGHSRRALTVLHWGPASAHRSLATGGRAPSSTAPPTPDHARGGSRAYLARPIPGKGRPFLGGPGGCLNEVFSPWKNRVGVGVMERPEFCFFFF